MRVKKAETPNVREKRSLLKGLSAGEAFRFANTTFEQALEGGDDGQTFFMVTGGKPAREDAVNIVSLDGKQVLVRDGSHEVIRHDINVEIQPAETESF